ncbi:MAG TPA: hypothetical protein VN461_11580 [Vicinamibacteria bacterium]|jgi:hypothetical protein|nr:hypothetical protein [Vicinamibacteria bacterium]
MIVSGALLSLVGFGAHWLPASPPIQHWEGWELAAISWTGLFALYYHFNSPFVGDFGFHRWMTLLCLVGVGLSAALAAVCLVLWHLHPSLHQLLDAHLWFAGFISAMLLLSDVLFYGRHDDPVEKAAFLQSALFADLPATFALVILIAFNTFHHFHLCGESLEAFLGGAISLQFLAANVVFVLIQGGLVSRAQAGSAGSFLTLLKISTVACILLAVVPFGFLVTHRRDEWIDFESWLGHEGAARRQFDLDQQEGNIRGLLSGAWNSGTSTSKRGFGRPEIQTVFYIPNQVCESSPGHPGKLAIKLQRIRDRPESQRFVCLFVTGTPSFADGTAGSVLLTRVASGDHEFAIVRHARWLELPDLVEAFVVTKYCESDLPYTDFIQIHTRKYLGTAPEDSGEAEVDVALESAKEVSRAHVWEMRPRAQGAGIPLEFREAGGVDAGISPLEPQFREWIHYVNSCVKGESEPRPGPTADGPSWKDAKQLLTEAAILLAESEYKYKRHCALTSTRNAVVFTYTLKIEHEPGAARPTTGP